MDLSQALINMAQWAESLKIATDNAIPNIEKALSDNYQTGMAPSKASAAMMEARQIEKALEEVNAAYERLTTSIYKSGSK
jgi:hypothetical protein